MGNAFPVLFAQFLSHYASRLAVADEIYAALDTKNCFLSFLASASNYQNGLITKYFYLKRRKESLLPTPEVIPFMLDCALAANVNASHVLMDSCFTMVCPVISRLTCPIYAAKVEFNTNR